MGAGSPPQQAGRRQLFENVVPGGDSTIFEVSKGSLVGQGGGDPAPFAQVVALAMPWERGRRPKGPEAKLGKQRKSRGPHLSRIFKVLPPAKGPGATLWETLKMGATALINVFQNIVFGLLGVAAGLPMRTQSHLERPRYIFDPS